MIQVTEVLTKNITQWSVEGKRRRGRSATSWMSDIKNWTGQGMAAASTSATDQDLWCELVIITERNLRHWTD